MTRYFAYGSNMVMAQMGRRCPGAKLAGTARLAGWRFLIMRSGYATVVPDPGHEVLGVLWDLTAAHAKALDGYEGVAQGHYRRETVTVTSLLDARDSRAMLYVGADTRPGVVVQGYLEPILAAARGLGFPDDYLRTLEAFRRPG